MCVNLSCCRRDSRLLSRLYRSQWEWRVSREFVQQPRRQSPPQHSSLQRQSRCSNWVLTPACDESWWQCGGVATTVVLVTSGGGGAAITPRKGVRAIITIRSQCNICNYPSLVRTDRHTPRIFNHNSIVPINPDSIEATSQDEHGHSYAVLVRIKEQHPAHIILNSCRSPHGRIR